jgi:hypothetical protein
MPVLIYPGFDLFLGSIAGSLYNKIAAAGEPGNPAERR